MWWAAYSKKYVFKWLQCCNSTLSHHAGSDLEGCLDSLCRSLFLNFCTAQQQARWSYCRKLGRPRRQRKNSMVQVDSFRVIHLNPNKLPRFGRIFFTDEFSGCLSVHFEVCQWWIARRNTESSVLSCPLYVQSNAIMKKGRHLTHVFFEQSLLA